MKKVAIFVDWENLKKEIEYICHNQRYRENLKKDDGKFLFNYNNVNNLIFLFKTFIDNKEEDLYRIFFYTANPLPLDEYNKRILDNPNFECTEKELFKTYCNNPSRKADKTNAQQIENIFKLSNNFLRILSAQDYMALRTGKLEIRGLKPSGEPNTVQKQVDMLMGLDISQVSYMRIVDRILIFCKDTDMKPALKIARINSVQTVLCSLQEGFEVDHELKKHTDIIRNRSFNNIAHDKKLTH